MFQFIKKLFSKVVTESAVAESSTDTKKQTFRGVIVLGYRDLIESRKGKVLMNISKDDFLHKALNEEEFLMAYFVLYEDGRGVTILKDRWGMFDSIPQSSTKIYNSIVPMNSCNAKSLLREQGYIGVFWSKEDIEFRLSERNLDLDEYSIESVVDYIEEAHDNSVGLSWSLVDEAIDYVLDENLSEEQE